MNATSRTSTPVAVGRFIASVRSVAASSDGLVVCAECRRHMSDMAETCPHCSAVVAAPPVATHALSGAHRAAATRVSGSGMRAIALLVLTLAAASYVVLRVAAP